jgi:hypothetical protein
MPITTAPRRRRLAAAAALFVLAPAVATVAAPPAASAQAFPAPGTGVNCADYTNIGWILVSETPPFGFRHYVGYTNFQLVSANPTFDVLEARFAENGQDEPQSATWTNTLSRTITTQVTIGVDVKVTEWLSTTVSATIIQTRTTSVGISVTATVPPHSRVLGEYGLSTYDVVFDGQRFNRSFATGNDSNSGICLAGPFERGTAHAPTIVEGWRVRPG